MNESRKNQKTANKLIHAIFLTLCFFLLPIKSSYSGNVQAKMVFYNVENLFDTADDPTTIDDEFLPQGDRFWDNRKLNFKLKRIYQTIMAASEGSLPVVIGLCEIENRMVLEMLLSKTPLGKMGYNIIHQESPDHRGIDVALLYNTRQFVPLKYQVYPIKNPNDNSFTTRDILHVEGVIERDTFHLFVNHWPSKYGGVIETKPLRALAAKQLKHAVDSLFSISQFNIVIMGDFNDSPIDESLYKHLNAKQPSDTLEQTAIYNLSYPHALKGEGTNRYHGKWEVIDQFIIGGNLLLKQIATEQSYKIFKADFLLEKDKNYLGLKPFRTYVGFKYNNGFSDHLPVILDLNLNKNSEEY